MSSTSQTGKIVLCWCGLLTIISFCSFSILQITNFKHHINSQTLPLSTWQFNRNNSDSNKSEEFKPNFAYILQTEKCLPPKWLTPDHLGNTTLCDCHVYVLSYREPCHDKVPHVRYLHNISVGWSAGRNVGYFAAKKHGYLYYLFIDDDVEITYNHYTPPEFVSKKIPPLQIFADYLLEHRPAASGVDFDIITRVDVVLDKWHKECKRITIKSSIPLYHFDALFNAYHKDIAEHLLPYAENYDKSSFWLSQLFLCFKFQVMFYGRFEYFPFLSSKNPAHRYDTKGYVHFLADPGIRKHMVETIRAQTPIEWKNHSRFDSIQTYNYEKNREAVLCIDPPKSRTPILPYQNMGPPLIY